MEKSGAYLNRLKEANHRLAEFNMDINQLNILLNNYSPGTGEGGQGEIPRRSDCSFSL